MTENLRRSKTSNQNDHKPLLQMFTILSNYIFKPISNRMTKIFKNLKTVPHLLNFLVYVKSRRFKKPEWIWSHHHQKIEKSNQGRGNYLIFCFGNKKCIVMCSFAPWEFFEWKLAPTIWIPRHFAGDWSKSTLPFKIF